MRFGMRLVEFEEMCEMAQDVYLNLTTQTDLELMLKGVTPEGETVFTAYAPEGGLGNNWSVTFRFRVLPSDDYLCNVQLMWATPDGHSVDRPKIYFAAHQLAGYVNRWFVDMEKIHNSWVAIFQAFPRN